MITTTHLRRLVTTLAVCATTLGMAAAPASSSDLPRNYIVVNVSTIDVNGVIDSDPANATGTAVNVSTGQTFSPATVAGTLIWQNLPDGDYRLQLGAGSGWAPVWWPGVYSQGASGIFRLDRNAVDCSPATIGPNGCYGLKYSTQVPQLRSLTGVVSNRSGQRVPAVPVTAVMLQQPATRFSTTTDSNGQFFLSVPPGTYELSAPNGNRRAAETVDVNAALVTRSLVLLDPPSSPTNVSVTPGGRSATVTWTAPADNGGSALTGYTATAMPGGATCSSTGTTSCTVTGLSNASVYTITVTASNEVGSSAASSPSAAFEPREPVPGLPTVPGSVRARAGSGQATVSWNPSETVLVTGYRVTSEPGGLTCTSTNLTCDVSGLTNGTRYTFTVVASSTAGDGPRSAASNAVTPADVPSAPRNVRMRPGDASGLVRWARPADNGGARVSGYTVTTFPSGRSCTTDGSVRGCAIGGLTNGESYSVIVTASNRRGTSERSPGSASSVPSSGLPSLAAPLTVKPKSGARKGPVRVKWSTSSPAERVSVRWQVSGSGSMVTRAVGLSGSLRIPVSAEGPTRVWVDAVNRKGFPVAQKARTYRR